MSNTASNVSAAKPRTTGAIFVAPVGTTLPTTANGTLEAAFKDLGYISEDGTSEDVSKNMTKIKAWGGDVVLLSEDSFENTIKFKLLEILNLDALKFAFGSSNVTGTALATGISVSKKRGNDTPVAIVIDTILTGGVLKRTVIPKGTLSGIGTIVQKANDTIGLDCTIDCAADASGNTSYDYYKSGE